MTNFYKHIIRFAILIFIFAAINPFSSLTVLAIGGSTSTAPVATTQPTSLKECKNFDQYTDGVVPKSILALKDNPGSGNEEQYNNYLADLQKEFDSCKLCNENLGPATTGGTFYKLFYLGNFIPVVPAKCTGSINLSLLTRVILRVYSFIASIAIYLLFVAIAIIAVRWVVGGLNGGEYAKNKDDLRNLVVALFIILIISTMIFELLRAIGLNESSLKL
jgi:hypothetical protein